MPFSVIQGGKYVSYVLLKHKPNRAIVFVRTKGKSSDTKSTISLGGVGGGGEGGGHPTGHWTSNTEVLCTVQLFL